MSKVSRDFKGDKVVITKDDMYDAIRGYKYQHCPVLSGLNRADLRKLVDRFDLDVMPSGRRRRQDGAGEGKKHKYPKRKDTTWKSMGDRTRGEDRYTGLVNKTKPVQAKRQEIAAAGVRDAEDIKDDIRKRISRRAREPKAEPKKPKMKLRFKK